MVSHSLFCYIGGSSYPRCSTWICWSGSTLDRFTYRWNLSRRVCVTGLCRPIIRNVYYPARLVRIFWSCGNIAKFQSLLPRFSPHCQRVVSNSLSCYTTLNHLPVQTFFSTASGKYESEASECLNYSALPCPTELYRALVIKPGWLLYT
jgi:hypothetical protein